MTSIKRLLTLALLCVALAVPAGAQLALTGAGLAVPSSGGGSGWTPATEGANLIADWKAENAVSAGGHVLYLADSSGNSNTIAPVSTTVMTYSATSFNGDPGISNPSGGSGTGLQNYTAAIPFNSSTITVMVIISPNFTSTDDPTYGQIGSLIGNGQSSWSNNNSSINYGFTYGSPNTMSCGSNASSANVNVTTGYQVLICQGNGTTFYSCTDTTCGSGSQGGTGPFGATTFPIGNFQLLQGGNYYFVWGIISEIALFSSAPTPANMYAYAKTRGAT
jgi:hypothetical protein